MIVEGEEDKFAIIQLMKHHTDWPTDRTKVPVWIKAEGSPTDILAQGFIRAKLKESGTKTLGIVFDADEQFENRWRRIRQISEKVFDEVPEGMPKGGLILQNDESRLGVWIMPDNAGHGMLETFLRELIADRHRHLIEYAGEVVAEARRKGADCKECHTHKSEIHSWLAWQDPPGQALGRAITSLTLDPHAESAKPFVRWVLDLYGLKAKDV
jgi:hypothetical protein